MVDSISGNSQQIQDAALRNVDQQRASESVEKVNVETAKETSNVASLQLLDKVNISDAAKQAYESEKEVLRFSRLAQRVQDSGSSERVAQLKSMVDSGRIQEYLRSVNTDDLADKILNSPTGAFLR